MKILVGFEQAGAPACYKCMLQAVFAHETGWAINITAFKLGESQRVSAKSLSLVIKRMTEWIGSETLAQCAK